MERAGRSRDIGGMLRRAAVLALAIAPALAQASDMDAAMHCVRGAMTSAFVPATASAEQLANVALMRCADEIEMAAVALAGAPIAASRIEASRIAVRRELHGYALAVAAGPATPSPSRSVSDVTTAW
jgi:hypothetical protein